MAFSKVYAAAGGDSDNNAAVVSGAFDSTGYNYVVAFLKHEGATATATPSDNKSSTGWASLTKRSHTNGDLAGQFYWAAIGSPGAGHTVTITLSAARPWKSLDVWLVDTDGATLQLDAQTTGEGSGVAAVDAGNLPNSGAVQVVSFMGVGPYAGGSNTPGSGWTEDQDGAIGGVTHHALSRGPETTSPIDPVSTLSGAIDWVACACSFKLAASGLTVNATTQALTWTALNATVTKGRAVAATTHALTMTALNAAVQLGSGRTINATTAALVLQGMQASVTGTPAVTPVSVVGGGGLRMRREPVRNRYVEELRAAVVVQLEQLERSADNHETAKQVKRIRRKAEQIKLSANVDSYIEAMVDELSILLGEALDAVFKSVRGRKH